MSYLKCMYNEIVKWSGYYIGEPPEGERSRIARLKRGRVTTGERASRFKRQADSIYSDEIFRSAVGRVEL